MMRKKSRQLSHYSEKLVIAYWLISTSWYSTAHLLCVETATLTKFVAKLVEASCQRCKSLWRWWYPSCLYICAGSRSKILDIWTQLVSWIYDTHSTLVQTITQSYETLSAHQVNRENTILLHNLSWRAIILNAKHNVKHLCWWDFERTQQLCRCKDPISWQLLYKVLFLTFSITPLLSAIPR